YSVSTLPGWLQAISRLSPATYFLHAIRQTVIEGAGVGAVAGDIAVMVAFAVVLTPLSIWVFGAAERWAKKTGRLKRHG
ncbi:MAG: ABC transporter permease, partial [Acidimicrobiia bacterium]|nr:ABC transporter permease [Acidimicrobiia bacterium]